MNPYIRKISATNLFIVPILGIGREKLLGVGFVEAFIKDELRELEYENAVYLLFRPERWEDFNEFVEEQREKKMPLVDEYVYSDGWAVLVYQYPKKFKRDVDIIMTGKFSQVGKEFKKAIPMYTKHTNAKGLVVSDMTNQHLIFEKDQKVKDYWKKELGLDFQKEDQVWLFYPEREVLNEASIERIKNLE